ncbi:hypothetical protein ZIOFF_006740 [Zingiber officinale]|uniref:Protein kinase domain-containing protein n=1 Tax=Zingiber officinale TaxID=94328 RepID=A0A8J5I2Y8_ZINOF|nr:hypothetical protein ZIOFF_006740 [Zingiber officinale]
MLDNEFCTEYGEGSRYHVQEVIGKGSYGVVGAAIDTHTGERVAIKKINDVFEHVSDATRILREIKLLRLLCHPDIVQIKHIMLPPSRREFKDISVVFELMESDLHQVIKANDDLTPEHHQFFLYQLLRALKYIHAGNVFHRDLKPKNILANSDCKLKVCDFGLARVAFNDAPSAIFWTDYVATRWYRAPELCGSFFSKVRWTESGVDRFKRQFAHLEEHCGNKGDTNVAIRQNASLPRERVGANRDRAADDNNRYEGHSTLESHTRSQSGERLDQPPVTDVNRSKIGARSLLKSESISASKCVVVKQRKDKEISALKDKELA